eukprot:437839-Rhodomonas_salina.1
MIICDCQFECQWPGPGRDSPAACGLGRALSGPGVCQCSLSGHLPVRARRDRDRDWASPSLASGRLARVTVRVTLRLARGYLPGIPAYYGTSTRGTGPAPRPGYTSLSPGWAELICGTGKATVGLTLTGTSSWDLESEP